MRSRLPATGRPARTLAVDGCAAVLSAVALAVGSGSAHAPPPVAARVPLALLVCLPVALPRRYPLAQVLLLLALGTAATVAVGGPMAWVYLPVAVLVYRVATEHDRRTSAAAVLVTVAAVGAQTLVWHLVGRGSGDAASACLLVLGAWGTGELVARHRAGVHRDRLRAAREAVDQERLRIARDLHDVVAHGMSMIAVQAAYGHYVFPAQPDRARTALATIETTSRQVLTEMRHLVSALRPEPGGDPAAPTRPVPGLADLPELVGQVAAAGVRVELTHAGDPRPLPPGVELTVYRVIQQALTNVVQHAGATTCEVRLDHGATGIGIRITDAGPPPGVDTRRPGPPGAGLTGMRERVGLYGGRLSCGPTPEGGYRVDAHLPVPAAS